MKDTIQKIGKFYSGIIMKYIDIFLFVGAASILFGKSGWFPNENLAAISQLVYQVILPCLIGFSAGSALGKEWGGTVGILAAVGVIAANSSVGILGAMILGPLCGLCTRRYATSLIEKSSASLRMLTRNIVLAVFGGIFCLFGFFVLAPVLGAASAIISHGVDFLIARKWLVFSSILIEPMKVFFLNNVVNHVILTPLGISQVEATGKSIFFLLETNPGPGLGVLLALFLHTRQQKYATGLFVQGIGGLHEVYFPFVWANPMLILSLIWGGMVGNACFMFTGAGLTSPVSPGSVLPILLMTEAGDHWGVLLGIVCSALVSFVTGYLILSMNRKEKTMEMDERSPLEEPKQTPIRTVGFVCDGGVGSSAMGAALFRKKMRAQGITDVEAKAYAVDQIPEQLDLIVCQKDYRGRLPETVQSQEIFTLDNLVGNEEYGKLITEIVKRNG